jgi:hypothetical protein
MVYKGVLIDILLLPAKCQNLKQLQCLYPGQSFAGWSKARIRKVILETLYRREVKK